MPSYASFCMIVVSIYIYIYNVLQKILSKSVAATWRSKVLVELAMDSWRRVNRPDLVTRVQADWDGTVDRKQRPV